MAKTVEQNLQEIIGGLVFQVAQLQSQLQLAQEQLAAAEQTKQNP